MTQTETEAPIAVDSGYHVPIWSSIPSVLFELEILKSGQIVDTLSISNKSHQIFGRQPDCHIILEHQSCSRKHAVLQFRQDGKQKTKQYEQTQANRIQNTKQQSK
jgi:hypothetical protein